MPLIQINNLTFTYPAATLAALNNISFTIEPGKMVAIVGLNNSGKSTLCHALTGVIPHFYHGNFLGNVTFDDLDTKTMTINEIARDVGFVTQIPANQLSGVRYTVFEEIAFSLENRGISRPEILKKTNEALALTGLADFSTRSPYQLSGGQQQKLALATVLATSPATLVLDEPTTFLDPQGRKDVFDILVQLKEQGTTIFIAEQHLEWVAEYADQVIVLAAGSLVLAGTPSKVLTDPAVKEFGMEWNRYTEVASLAQAKGTWPKQKPLPLTFAETIADLQSLRK